MIASSWIASPVFHSLKHFPFLLFQRFHGDCVRRATLGAESAADALFFVLDDGPRLAGAQLLRRGAEHLFDESPVVFVTLHLDQIHEAQAELRTDVDAAIA